MNNLPPAVSDLPPDGAALVDYPEYRSKHPPPVEDETNNSAGRRVLILYPLRGVRINYSWYDEIVCLPGVIPNPDGSDDTDEAAALVETTFFELRRKES